MVRLVDIRKLAAALIIGAALLAAAVPLCQTVVCDNMATPMAASPIAEFGSACGAAVPNALLGVVARTWQTAGVRLAGMATLNALAMSPSSVRFVLNRDGSAAPPPPADPLGVRILI